VRIILGFLLIAFVSVVGSRFMRARTSPASKGFGLVESGALFLLFGVLLGPSVMAVFDEGVLAQIEPIAIIGVGWIGFLFGLHLEWRLLKKVSARLYALVFSEALVTFTAVFVALAGLLVHGGWPVSLSGMALWAAPLVLAACASGSAPSRAFWLASRLKAGSDTGDALRVVASLDDVPGLLIFGAFFALDPSLSSRAVGWNSALAFLMSIGLGVLAALFLREILPRTSSRQVNLALVLGVVAFFSGVAAMINLSPLFVGAASGVAFANLSVRKESVYEAVYESEHAIYVLFLLVVGAFWKPPFSWQFVAVLALYVAVRIATKAGTVAAAARLARAAGGSYPSRLMGFGLLSQGGLALAMAMDYQRTYGKAAPFDALSVLIAAVLINELVGWFAAKRLALRGLR